MNLKEAQRLLQDQQLSNDLYVAFILRDDQNPKDMLDHFKNKGFHTFLRQTSFGIEIVITGQNLQAE